MSADLPMPAAEALAWLWPPESWFCDWGGEEPPGPSDMLAWIAAPRGCLFRIEGDLDSVDHLAVTRGDWTLSRVVFPGDDVAAMAREALRMLEVAVV